MRVTRRTSLQEGDRAAESPGHAKERLTVSECARGPCGASCCNAWSMSTSEISVTWVTRTTMPRIVERRSPGLPAQFCQGIESFNYVLQLPEITVFIEDSTIADDLGHRFRRAHCRRCLHRSAHEPVRRIDTVLGLQHRIRPNGAEVTYERAGSLWHRVPRSGCKRSLRLQIIDLERRATQLSTDFHRLNVMLLTGWRYAKHVLFLANNRSGPIKNQRDNRRGNRHDKVAGGLTLEREIRVLIFIAAAKMERVACACRSTFSASCNSLMHVCNGYVASLSGIINKNSTLFKERP